MSSPVEQEVPQTPSIEDLMKQLEEHKRIAAEATAKLQEQAVKLNAIEKQREKIPIKLYTIHRKIHYEFVNTIEARTVEEAKQIANSTSLNDMFKNWKRVNKSSTSYKKKTDPVINPKTGEPFRPNLGFFEPNFKGKNTNLKLFFLFNSIIALETEKNPLNLCSLNSVQKFIIYLYILINLRIIYFLIYS